MDDAAVVVVLKYVASIIFSLKNGIIGHERCVGIKTLDCAGEDQPVRTGADVGVRNAAKIASNLVFVKNGAVSRVCGRKNQNGAAGLICAVSDR